MSRSKQSCHAASRASFGHCFCCPRKSATSRIDHHLHQLGKGDLGRPAQSAVGLGRVGQEHIDLRRPVEFRIDDDITAPIQADTVEGDGDKLLHGVRFAGADDIVLGHVLLQHKPYILSSPHISMLDRSE